MQTKTQMNGESPAGLLVVDSGNEPVYADAEAIRVLAYPEDPEKIKSSGRYLAEKIRSVVPNGEAAACLLSARDFVSGRRQYRCRSFVLKSNVLESNSNKSALRIVGILMERVHHASFLVSARGDQFRLTSREKETVRLLSAGLTTKEIAGRMRISPNTVKAFLRQIMFKMGVSNRSGILAKALRH